MHFDAYMAELQVLELGKSILANPDAADLQAEYKALLKNYAKLLKTTKRLVHMSDRSEAKLTQVSKVLDEKNKMLEELSGKLARYLSPQVFKSIFSGDKDVALSTERKKLTVFFSDIKDFTLISDDLQPEDLTHFLNTYFTEMSLIALKHGATIDKFIGDAMLLFFGDPETRGVEEDAKACVRMALAMQARMAEIEREWQATGLDKPFKMRVGVNTGYCNVGNFGSADRMDYTIIGGEVNLAARLESQADPGGILLSYETYALTRDIVTAVERPPLTVKGIRREVRNFAVIEAIGNDGSPDRARRLLNLVREGVGLAEGLADLDTPTRQQVLADLEQLAGLLGAKQPR